MLNKPLRKALDFCKFFLLDCLYCSIHPLTKENPLIVIHKSMIMFSKIFSSSSPKSAATIAQCDWTSSPVAILLSNPCLPTVDARLCTLLFLSCCLTTSSTDWNTINVASLTCHSPPLSTKFNQASELPSLSSSSSHSKRSMIPITSSSFNGWDDLSSFFRRFRQTYPAAYRRAFSSCIEREGRSSSACAFPSSGNWCFIISLKMRLVRCWVRMRVAGSPNANAVNDDHWERNSGEVRILWYWAHIFSRFRLTRFMFESNASFRRAVTLVPKDRSFASFSFFEAHSSSLTAEVLAVEALAEEILNPSSSSTSRNTFLISSAAPS